MLDARDHPVRASLGVGQSVFLRGPASVRTIAHGRARVKRANPTGRGRPAPIIRGMCEQFVARAAEPFRLDELWPFAERLERYGLAGFGWGVPGCATPAASRRIGA